MFSFFERLFEAFQMLVHWFAFFIRSSDSLEIVHVSSSVSSAIISEYTHMHDASVLVALSFCLCCTLKNPRLCLVLAELHKLSVLMYELNLVRFSV